MTIGYEYMNIIKQFLPTLFFGGKEGEVNLLNRALLVVGKSDSMVFHVLVRVEGMRFLLMSKVML